MEYLNLPFILFSLIICDIARFVVVFGRFVFSKVSCNHVFLYYHFKIIKNKFHDEL